MMGSSSPSITKLSDNEVSGMFNTRVQYKLHQTGLVLNDIVRSSNSMI